MLEFEYEKFYNNEKRCINMKDFGFNWRFTDEKYNLLPKNDLMLIRPLNKEISNEIWGNLIDNNVNHYALIKKKVNLATDLVIDDCGWGDESKENNTQEYLIKHIKWNMDSKIMFFWNKDHAVETEWNIFLKYWTDFCYSSDDSNIIINQNSKKAIIYVEDRMLIVDRKIHFNKNV